jgi:p-cumate 2,3-dioxygenase beta subunit
MIINGDIIREVEQFLFEEANLLDSRQFVKWANLFTDNGIYQVPPTNLPDADPKTSLFLINDDRFRIGARAERLTKKGAHAEFPASRTCRMVSNVVAHPADDGKIEAAANFVAYRYRAGTMDIFPGRSVYLLERDDSQALRIASKKSTLALESLRPHAKVSIIL